MKTIAIIFLTTTLFITACIKEKCNNPTYVPRAKLMDEYFGNYKPGAYWIYLNRDSTKRDSVWVDSFGITKVKNQYDCEYAEVKHMALRSNYLLIYNKIGLFSIDFNGNDLYTNCLITYNNDWICAARNDSNNFYLPEVNLITGKRTVFPFIANYQIWQNQPPLDKVSILKRIVIAPKIGIVQFFPTNSNDTFSLIKYHIP